MTRRTLLWTLGSGLTVGGVVLGAWVWSHQRYKHLATHDPGMVYRCAWLEADVFPEVIERYQIKSVINLCELDEMGDARRQAEREAVTRAGAKLIELPLPKTTDASHPSVQRHLEVLLDPDSYPLLIHCQHGVTRTAMELAMYDIAVRNLTADQSLTAMPLFGRNDHPVPIRAFARDFERRHGGKTVRQAARVTGLK